MPWIETDYLRFFPSLTWQVDPRIPGLVAETPDDAVVVDLGAGGRKITAKTICVDFVPFPSTSVVADVQALPFRDDSVDLVIGTGLLEHVEDDRQVLSEVARVLKPGGRAHMEVPFMQQYHDDPIDCRRYSLPGLAREVERAGFEVLHSGVHIGPTVTIITHWAYYASLWLEGRNVVAKAASTLVFFVFSVLLWPAKFLDRFLVGKKSAHRLAFGVYCTGRKRTAIRDS